MKSLKMVSLVSNLVLLISFKWKLYFKFNILMCSQSSTASDSGIYLPKSVFTIELSS